LAESSGFCIIQNPHVETWSPEQKLDTFFRNVKENIAKRGGSSKAEDLEFVTKEQAIHRLRERYAGPVEQFISCLCVFLAKRKTPLTTFPVVDSKILDLYQLFLGVERCGGLEKVTKHKLWRHVTIHYCRISPVFTSASFTVKKWYKALLADFVEDLRLNHPRLYIKFLRLDKQTKVPAKVRRALVQLPEDDSFADERLSQEERELTRNFGYDVGERFTLDSFRVLADKYKAKFFAYTADDAAVTPEEIAREYWRVVENADSWVQVYYGSDVCVKNVKTSGYPIHDPRSQASSSAESSASEWGGWNLNYLPQAHGSVVKHVKQEIPGVVTPFLYIGMLFSSFCWHTEDNYFYSVNYLHAGAPKQWYVVPASHSRQFEEVFREQLPDVFRAQPQLLYQLVTQISPSHLVKKQIPVYQWLQQPGEMVITFPKAYHAGFSHGFNCAESVNFATVDWIPWLLASADDYRDVPRSSVLSPEEYLLGAARATLQGVYTEPRTVTMFVEQLSKVIQTEKERRKSLLSVVGQNSTLPLPSSPGCTVQCESCLRDCYFSHVLCTRCKSTPLCERHIGECACEEFTPAGLHLVMHGKTEELLNLFGELKEKLDELRRQ